jgi:acyl-CoA synthetase (AMP-forming)/AMP-acid ligase II
VAVPRRAAAVATRLSFRAREGTFDEDGYLTLARFKVPEKILSVDAIPKGATGKLQRRGMAERLGIIAL